MKKHMLFILMVAMGFANLYAQVTDFPYICNFEIGPDGTEIVGTEPNWDGSNQWDYDDSRKITGTFSATSTINTTTDDSRNIFVLFDASTQTGIKPSIYYHCTNQNIRIQVVGEIGTSGWTTLKDWFIPISGTWTMVDFSTLSNLVIFDNQSECKFGIRAKKVEGQATLKIDNIQLITDNSDIWNLEASTTDWNTPGNWFSKTVPTSAKDIVIPQYGSTYPSVSSADANCNNIYISPQACLTIDNTFTLNVSGDFRVQSDPTGTGSFINDGTLNMSGGGTKYFERYIAAYTSSEDGWHQISSPMNCFTIAGSNFVPGDDDDLYKWDEATWQWINYKPAPFVCENGKGYLAAYVSSETHVFSGEFNCSNTPFTDLSVGTGNGWHLLGNPFPSAIEWNFTTWALSSISYTAKVYSNAAGNYIDITNSEIIPASQGFFVQATDAVNSLNIPLSCRSHATAQDLYACPAQPRMKLKVSGGQNLFYDLTSVGFNPEASWAYDYKFDSRKLCGQNSAPQLFSFWEEESLSTNTLPTVNNAIVDIRFMAGTNGEYQIAPCLLEGFASQITIYLEDLFLDSLINMKQDSLYHFYAQTNDNSERFLLHFNDATAIDENATNLTNKPYFSEGAIHFPDYQTSTNKDIYLFDPSGKLVYSALNVGHTHVIKRSLPFGIYILKHTSQPGTSIKLLIH
jgi:hypothetical protein